MSEEHVVREPKKYKVKWYTYNFRTSDWGANNNSVEQKVFIGRNR